MEEIPPAIRLPHVESTGLRNRETSQIKRSVFRNVALHPKHDRL
jgi:hypothetical protein